MINAYLAYVTKVFFKSFAGKWPRKVADGLQSLRGKSLSILHYVIAWTVYLRMTKLKIILGDFVSLKC